MKVLITGINGFIANRLAEYLVTKNIEVYGTSSKKIKNKNTIETYSLKIGDTLDINKDDFDWVIHAVYDKNSSLQENKESIISWAQELYSKGVTKQLFISSISAVSGNDSEYSLIKKETEQWFLEQNMYVIRPGLVVGNGGLFAQMLKKVQSTPLIPLVNGGSQNTKLIGINDLIGEIFNILNGNQVKKEINIFYKNSFILKDLLNEISKYYSKKIFFINIPFGIMFLLARSLEILHINIGVSSQNIKGLTSNDTNIKNDFEQEKDLSKIFKENL